MKIWEIVKEIEEKDVAKNAPKLQEYGESKATMLVNFGPTGRTIPYLINETDKLPQMIVKVFTYYHEQVQEYKNQQKERIEKDWR